MVHLDSDGTELLDRITVRPDVLGGKPVIRGLRIAVEHVLAMLAAGDTPETILREYRTLTSRRVCRLRTARSPDNRATGAARPSQPHHSAHLGSEKARSMNGPTDLPKIAIPVSCGSG